MIQRIGEALYYIPSGADTMIRYALPEFQRTDIPLPEQANKQFFNTFLVDGQIIYYQDIYNQLTGFNPFTLQATSIPLEFVPQKRIVRGVRCKRLERAGSLWAQRQQAC